MVLKLNNGDIIRTYRKRKKLTMKELGQKVGVSEQAISQYERSIRTPNVITLQKICMVLNLPIENLAIELPILPTENDIDKNPNLALDTQINIYIDDIDKIKVKMLCKMFECFNYEVEIDKNIALIIDKVTDETYVKMTKDEFIHMSELCFWQTQGLIDNLKYKYNSKK